MNKQLTEFYKQAFGYPPAPSGEPELEKFATLVAAAEREACAKVAEDYWDEGHCEIAVREIAAEIRARGGEMSGRIKHQEIFVALAQTGLTQHFEYRSPVEYDSSRRLEQFVEIIAAKAAAAEREACAEICACEAKRWGESPKLTLSVAAEHWMKGYEEGANSSAEKIRARGQE